MRPSMEREILAVWEEARGLHPVDQALVMLSAIEPSAGRDDLAVMSIGRRDSLLFILRQTWFGDSLDTLTQCPRCREELEMTLPCGQMTAERKPSPVSPIKMETKDLLLTVRLPDSFDLAAIAAAPSIAAARAILFGRCVVSAIRSGDVVAADELPEGVVKEVSDVLAEADPQAEVILDLQCPACSHIWQGMLDIVHILWAEIDAHVRRLLYDVHRIASVYGWSETEILAMNPARREIYLQMLPI